MSITYEQGIGSLVFRAVIDAHTTTRLLWCRRCYVVIHIVYALDKVDILVVFHLSVLIAVNSLT